jgi:glycosyltransferase involved in cell wall biosynthesis
MTGNMRTVAESGGSGQARLLDVTRLVSRAGRLPTGIDRVERAWLVRLLSEEIPLLGLLRTPFGYLLLDRRGLAHLERSIAEGVGDRPDLLSRLSSRRPEAVRGLESALRAMAVGRSLHRGLGRLLARHLPRGVTAFNVGHADLSEQSLGALKAVPGLRLVVMVHDTIPLDHPDFQREGAAEVFAAKFRAAARHADRIICPSAAAAADVARHLRREGSGARVVTAPLGVEPVAPRPGDLPPGLPPEGPYVVVLGTIEPRKNHAVLLDAWEMMGAAAPWLVICGARGWRNAAIFARLDRQPPRVREAAGLTDGAVAALLAGAQALLFPSLAEGFGLPLVEAAVQGTPVLCSDLPVCREVAGPGAVFLDPREPETWARAVMRLKDDTSPRRRMVAPTWAQHFNIALGMA